MKTVKNKEEMTKEKLMESPFPADRAVGREYVKELETIKNVTPVERKYKLIKETVIVSVSIACATLIINRCLKIFGKNKIEVKVKTADKEK